MAKGPVGQSAGHLAWPYSYQTFLRLSSYKLNFRLVNVDALLGVILYYFTTWACCDTPGGQATRQAGSQSAGQAVQLLLSPSCKDDAHSG